MSIVSAAPPPPSLPHQGGNAVLCVWSGRAAGVARNLPHHGGGRWGWGHKLGVLVLALAGFVSPSLAQSLPYHADPSAREVPPSLTAVPAIRFLTTADFPPFNFRDGGGELIGFNIDLARRICAEVDVACTIQAWPWEQVTDALADNQGDALIAGLALTPENGERFDFTATYLALPGRFVTRLENAERFDPARLADRTVAVRAGSAHASFMQRYLPDVPV